MTNDSSPPPGLSGIFGVGCVSIVFTATLTLSALIVIRLSLGPDWLGWWRQHFADPVFVFNTWVLVQTKGQPFAALAIVGFVYWLVGWAMLYIPTRISRASVYQFRSITPQTTEFEAVQQRLRSVLSEDLEETALRESQAALDNTSRGERARHLWLYSTGCLFSVLWAIITMPVAIAISIAQFDAIRGIYDGYVPSGQSTSEMSNQVQQLTAHISTWQFAGSRSDERSMILTVALVLLAVARWLVAISPAQALALPRGIPRLSWLVTLASAALVYWLLNSATIYFMCAVICSDLVHEFAVNFVFRPIAARLYGLTMRLRTRLGIPREADTI